jgi:hypothetical protein
VEAGAAASKAAAETVAEERFDEIVRLGNECARRLDLIRDQESAIAALRQAADARAAAEAAAAERLASMVELQRVADERLAVILRLERDLRGKYSPRAFLERFVGAILPNRGQH